MTKFIISLSLLLLSLLSFAQNQPKLTVSADIRGRSCGGGFGLCSTNALKVDTNATVTAQKLSEKIVVFSFEKSVLSKQNQESMAGKEFSKIAANEKIDFVQEDDIAIESKTLLDLGFDPKYTVIKKGSYPMIIDTDKVLVTFTLAEK